MQSSAAQPGPSPPTFPSVASSPGVTVKGRYGSYELQGILGKGGSAVVYRAIDCVTEQVVAVKKITALDDETMHQWRTEVETLMALRDDDNGSHHVIRYLDHMQAAKTIFIVEEYAAEGSLLAQLRARGRAYTEREAGRLAYQITSGLAYIHSEGIVHCDVKCANALVCADGQVKLSDFGLAAVSAPQLAAAAAAATSSSEAQAPHGGAADGEDAEDPSNAEPRSPETNRVLGSVYWMAPEIVKGEKHAFSSDIWSLGCLCVELLSGKPPFYDRPPANALYCIANHTDPVALPTTDPPLSEDAKRFIQSCLARDAARRPSASALLRSPFFADARGRERVEALTAEMESLGDGAYGRGAGGGSSSSSDQVGAWVENCLFETCDAERDEWLSQGWVNRVAYVLPRLSPDDAFLVIRALSYAAGAWTSSVADALDSRALWTFRSKNITQQTPTHYATIFSVCCDHQTVQASCFAPAYPPAIRFLLSCRHDGVARSTAAALHRLYCLSAEELCGADDVSRSDSSGNVFPSRKERRTEALNRLILDGGLQAVRLCLEDMCQSSLQRDEAPPMGWEDADMLFEVVLAAATVAPGGEACVWEGISSPGLPQRDGTDRRTFSAATASELTGGKSSSVRSPVETSSNLLELVEDGTRPLLLWYLALQEGTRRSCPSAVLLLVELVQRLAGQQEAQTGRSGERTAANGAGGKAIDGTVAGAETGSGAGGSVDARRAEGESAFLETAGASLAGLLLTAACGRALPPRARLAAVQCLPLLHRSSARAAPFLADDFRAVPLYAYLLARVPAPHAGGRAAVLQALLDMCSGDKRLATACGRSALMAHALAELLCEIAAELSDAAAEERSSNPLEARGGGLSDDNAVRRVELTLGWQLARALPCSLGGSNTALMAATADLLQDDAAAVQGLQRYAASADCPHDCALICEEALNAAAATAAQASLETPVLNHKSASAGALSGGATSLSFSGPASPAVASPCVPRAAS